MTFYVTWHLSYNAIQCHTITYNVIQHSCHYNRDGHDDDDDSDSDEGNDEVDEIITLDHSGKLRNMEDLDYRKKMRSQISTGSGAEAKENHEGGNHEPSNIDKEAAEGEDDEEDYPDKWSEGVLASLVLH